jgi:putative MATE family efflux protein
MLVVAAYNMVDAIFVGRFVGEVGLAALGSCIPAVILLMGFSLFVGVGGSTAISRKLGMEDGLAANQVLGNMMFLVLVLAAISLVLAILGTAWVFERFGTSEDLVIPASQYLDILLAGGPFSVFSVMMNNVVRAEGNARMAMFSMVTGALVNVALDPLFIYTFGWGMRGAALATVVAHLVTTLIMIGYLRSGKSSLRLRVEAIRFDLPIVREISAVGVSTLLINTSATIIQSLVIKTLVEYGGASSVSVYTMCNRTMMFLFMPVFGLQAGVLPIIGYNYSAKLMKRVRQAIFSSMVICTVYLSLGWTFIQLYPELFIGVFTGDAELLREGISAIRKLAVAFPIVGIPILIVGTFQAIGMARYALFLTTNRTFILVIPLLLILPRQLGTDGVWYAFPLADSVAALVNTLLFWRVSKRFRG